MTETTASDLPLLEELELNRLRESFDEKRRKEVLEIVGAHRVRKLIVHGFHHAYDPGHSDWLLALLLRVAPHVEEVAVDAVRIAHWPALHAMPRLRRLDVLGAAPPEEAVYPDSVPAELPPRPAHHVGLRWLRVAWVSRATTFSLIRAHAGTLEELQLFVDCVPESERAEWPAACDDLHAELGRCGLTSLRRLVLLRTIYMRGDRNSPAVPAELGLGIGFGHKKGSCRNQLGAVRGALPAGVQVLCHHCDDVPTAW